MAAIKNSSTGEITEITCVVEGQDILGDVMGGSGIPTEATEPGAWAFVLDEEETRWWARWAEREERITAAYEDANEDERRAYEEAINEWGHDLEALQDAQEVALGLAGYQVVVDIDDDASEATLLLERYANEEDALARLEEIKSDAAENGGWGEGTRVTAWQILDGGNLAASLDTAPLA